MRASKLRDFLDSPLAEALASDVAIMGGLGVIRSVLRANRRAVSLRNQQGDTAPTGTATLPPPLAPPKNLPEALLALEADKIEEVTKWMKNLQYTHKALLSSWELEDLKKLFGFPAETRTQLLSAITGPTPTEQVEEITHWIRERLPHLLNDESKAIIKEWEDWADEVLARK